MKRNSVWLLVALVVAGLAVDVFLKSERIQVSPGRAVSADGRNHLTGTLRDAIFKGQYADFIVSLPCGHEIVASGTPELAALEKNQPVTLSWAPDAADAFAIERG